MKKLFIVLVFCSSCIVPSKYDLELVHTIADQSKLHSTDMMLMNEELVKLQLQMFLFQQGFMHQTPFYGKATRVR